MTRIEDEKRVDKIIHKKKISVEMRLTMVF